MTCILCSVICNVGRLIFLSNTTDFALCFDYSEFKSVFSKTELSNSYGGPWLLRYNVQKEKDENNSCLLFSLGLVMFFVFFF